MRAQWVCSRDWRIMLHKQSSINQSINMSSHFNVKQPATYRSSHFDIIIKQPATDFTSHFSFKHPTTDSSSHFNVSQPATIKSVDVVNYSITKQAITIQSWHFNVKRPCHVQWTGYCLKSMIVKHTATDKPSLLQFTLNIRHHTHTHTQ